MSTCTCGKPAVCKGKCGTCYNREWRQRNRARVNEYGRRYYARNKDRIDAKNKRYRELNPEKVKEQAQTYYERTREQRAVYCRDYYEDNRESLSKKRIRQYRRNHEQELAQRRDYRERRRAHGGPLGPARRRDGQVIQQERRCADHTDPHGRRAVVQVKVPGWGYLVPQRGATV